MAFTLKIQYGDSTGGAHPAVPLTGFYFVLFHSHTDTAL